MKVRSMTKINLSTFTINGCEAMVQTYDRATRTYTGYILNLANTVERTSWNASGFNSDDFMHSISFHHTLSALERWKALDPDQQCEIREMWGDGNDREAWELFLDEEQHNATAKQHNHTGLIVTTIILAILLWVLFGPLP